MKRTKRMRQTRTLTRNQKILIINLDSTDLSTFTSRFLQATRRSFWITICVLRTNKLTRTGKHREKLTKSSESFLQILTIILSKQSRRTRSRMRMRWGNRVSILKSLSNLSSNYPNF